MAMKLYVSEILKKLSEFKGAGSVEKRAQWLKDNDSPTLRLILNHAFNPTISYNLPEGSPPFTPNKAEIDQTETSLFAETRKLAYLWVTASDSALENLTDTQQAQLQQALDKQTEVTDAYVALEAAHKVARQEEIDAREAIEKAKLRYNAAIEGVRKSTSALQKVKENADYVAWVVGEVKKKLYATNAELQGRALPTTPNIPKHRLESMFIQLLESVHPDEAKVILGVKNKTLHKDFHITRDVVEKAFPGLLPTQD